MPLVHLCFIEFPPWTNCCLDGRPEVVALVKADRTTFASEDWRDAYDTEGARAFKEYFGYFGTYSIDQKKRAVIHHIEGAWFPNLLGTNQVRVFQFVGDQLVLDADTEWGKVRIEWKRAKNAALSI